MKVGPAIKTLREQKGMTQKDLADGIGKDFSYISHIEKGTREPKYDVLNGIASTLDVPFHVLLLMAAEQDELNGLDVEKARRVGRLLVDIIHEVKREDEADPGPPECGVFPVRSMGHLASLLGVTRRKRTAFMALAESSDKRYRQKEIPKGYDDQGNVTDTRTLDIPLGDLLDIQRKILREMLQTISLPATMLGGVQGRTIKDNAMIHVGQKQVVAVDIKSGFPSTSHRRVFRVFRNTLGCSDDVARMLTRLTTTKGYLPQGAPTSTMVFNLCMLGIESRLAAFASGANLCHSLWVDDIALSGDNAVDAIPDVIKIIIDDGYAVRTKKVKAMVGGGEVTGIQVGEGLSVRRDVVTDIRTSILALDRLSPDYASNLASVIGRVSHVNWINPNQGAGLKKLLEHMKRLEERDKLVANALVDSSSPS